MNTARKVIGIKKIRGVNFESVTDWTINLSDITYIKGGNRQGKTTICNMITWLLTERSTTDISGFDPKPIDKDGIKHRMRTSVTGDLILADKSIIQIERACKENWVKKRGETEHTLSGNIYEYFISGKKVNATTFNKWIAGHITDDPERILMAMLPKHYALRTAPIDRRKELLSMVSETTIGDILEQEPEEKVLESLGISKDTKINTIFDIDKKITHLTKQLRENKKELESIPYLIAEAKKAIPEGVYKQPLSEKQVAEKIKEEISLLEIKQTTKENILSNLEKSDDKVKEERKKLEKDIIELENKFLKKEIAEKEELYKKTNSIKKDYNNANSQKDKLILLMTEKSRLLTELKSNRKRAVSNYIAISERKWDNGTTICPTCNQDIPKEDIEKKKKEFLDNKKNDLELAILEGKKYSQENIENLQEEIEITKEKADAYAVISSTKKKEIDEITIIMEAKAEASINEDKQYLSLMKKIEAIKNKNVSTDEVSLSDVNKEILDKEDNIKKLEKLKTQFETATKQTNRVKELKEKEVNLETIIEELDKIIIKGQELSRIILESKINLLFTGIKIRLFEPVMNGKNEYRDTCEILVPGENGEEIPFKSANNAAQLTAGAELIEVFSQEWGFKLPIITDNSEGISQRERYISNNHQQIFAEFIDISNIFVDGVSPKNGEFLYEEELDDRNLAVS